MRLGHALCVGVAFLWTIACEPGAPDPSSNVPSGTWSVVAVDVDGNEVGVALATCVETGFTVASSRVGGSEDSAAGMVYRVWTDLPGSEIELARLLPGHGAVAAQAYVDPGNSSRIDRAEARLLDGASAQDAIVAAISADPFAQDRQYGVAALLSKAANFTGSETLAWSGAASGQFVSVQGNILVGPEVVGAGLEAFHQAMEQPDGALSDGLVAALEAGAMQGGDERCPREQAALGAFAAVARRGDRGEALSLWLTVPPQRLGGQNPVTLLRQAYDEGSPPFVEDDGIKSDRAHPALWGLTALVIPLAGLVFWTARRRIGWTSPERGT
ncbi:MAG: DUF1028 domain-containing protein [bacterium]|nr:DUF1028 domain-containing protein [bacterium]